jgi:anhydro-N-acetylmuramic acid kinase
MIKEKTINELIIPDKPLIEFKEAIVFGFLGVLKLREEVNCLSSVTGAKQNHCSGKIYNH